MKKLKMILTILSITLILIACEDSNTTENKDLLKIGVLQYTSHEALDATYDGFISELSNLGLVENEDYVIDYHNAQGDTANTETIASKIVNDNPDLIYAIATPAAQAIANKTSDIPVIFSALTDPISAGLVESNEKPNTNISGVSDLTPVKRQIELMKEIAPDTKRVWVVYANSEDNSRYQASIAEAEIKALGMDYIDASVSDANQLQQVVESLVGKVDAIYVPTDNLVAESYSIVTNIAYDNNIVTVSGESGMVLAGGLITDGIEYLSVGKRAGAMAYDVLVDKADISLIPVVYLEESDLSLYVNITVADHLGIIIPDEILNNANIIE